MNVLRNHPDMTGDVLPLFDRCLSHPKNDKDSFKVVSSPMGFLSEVMDKNSQNHKIMDNLFDIYKKKKKHQKSFEPKDVISVMGMFSNESPHLIPKVLENVDKMTITPEVSDSASFLLYECVRKVPSSKLQAMDTFGKILEKDPSKHKELYSFLAEKMTDEKSASKGLDIIKQFYEQCRKDQSLKWADDSMRVSAHLVCDVARKFPNLSDKVLDTLDCGLKYKPENLSSGHFIEVPAMLVDMAAKNPEKLEKIDSLHRMTMPNLPKNASLSQCNKDGSISLFMYDSNNELKQKYTVKDGVTHGEQFLRHMNMTLITNEVNGQKDGRELLIDPDGTLHVKIYNKGEISNFSVLTPKPSEYQIGKDNVLTVKGNNGVLKVWPDGTSLEVDIKNQRVIRTNKDRSCQVLSGDYAKSYLSAPYDGKNSKKLIENFDKAFAKQMTDYVFSQKMTKSKGSEK